MSTPPKPPTETELLRHTYDAWPTWTGKIPPSPHRNLYRVKEGVLVKA